MDANSVMAAAAPIVRNIPVGVAGTSFTWGTIFGGLQTLLLSSIGGGGVFAGMRIWAQMRKDKAENDVKLKALHSGDDTSLRSDLMKMLKDNEERSSIRIANLEKAVIDERRICAEALADQNKRHAEDMVAQQKRYDEQIALLQGEIKGLRDNLIQHSKSQVVLINESRPPVEMQGSLDKLDERGS